MVTIKDVARQAGVSTATISYVLNGTKPVGEDVERRVLEAARAFNYLPNAAARNLRKNETRIIGYELPIPLDGDMASLMHQFTYQLTIAAAQAGYHLMTFSAAPGYPVLDNYRELIHSQRVDGFVVSNTNWQDPRVELLIDSPIPFVAFGRANPELQFAYVDVDGYSGMQQVATHLLDCGYRRIAFVGWPAGSVSGDARFEGLRDALHDAGVEIDPLLDCRVLNSVNEGYRAAMHLMQQSPVPQAIVCVSDVLAVGVMRCLTEHGCRVGIDIAVTGFDNIPLAEFLSPSLTTVNQPLDLIGEQLISILLSHVKGNVQLPEPQILLAPSLVIRESTQPR